LLLRDLFELAPARRIEPQAVSLGWGHDILSGDDVCSVFMDRAPRSLTLSRVAPSSS
jgi:hypothetical protein